ncbi:MAG: hypothetical protein WC889_19260, partial [Myxococcota bacterium]
DKGTGGVATPELFLETGEEVFFDQPFVLAAVFTRDVGQKLLVQVSGAGTHIEYQLTAEQKAAGTVSFEMLFSSPAGVATSITLKAVLVAAGGQSDAATKDFTVKSRSGDRDAGTDSGVTDGGVADGGPDAGPEICTDLPARFDQDTTIKKGCYLAKKSPVIAAAVKITLEPGVKVVFSQDTGMTISGNQVLVAAGTVDDPIILTGEGKARGSWKGLVFDGNLIADSRLDYVVVEYAGSVKSDKDAAAVKLVADSRGARLSMTHTMLKQSQGWGLWLTGSAVLPQFAANVISGNQLGPVNADAEVVGVLDAASKYNGNDVDQVRVRAYRLSKAARWAALGVPYYLESSLSLSADLTVAPGVTFIMAEGFGLTVSGDASALIAVGTAQAPIVFTGESKARGSWKGIIFDGSNNNRNKMSHVTVEWAGSTASDVDGAAVKLIADSHGVQLNMSQTTLKQSQGWGLYMVGSAIVPAFTGNVLTQNLLGPASVDSDSAHQLLPASTYTGNDVDRVRVRTNRVSQAVTWSDIGVPYILDGGVAVDLVWTLAPGVTLIMEQDAGINVNGDAAGFYAVGTSAKPILITGATKTAGDWNSIVFSGSNNASNVLDHCTVEYGGGGSKYGWEGMIFATADSHGVTLTVTNSTIQNSGVWGIWLCTSAVSTLENNTMTGNTLGDVYQQVP